MKYLLTALVCVALVGELAQAARLSSHEWKLFKSKHGKSYESPAEEARRFANFMAAKQRVESHNAKADSSFRMELNHMSDWTEEEFAKMNGFKVDESIIMEAQESSKENEAFLAELHSSSSDPVPDELDWRKVPGRVTPVKDQGLCGSCWAFSAIGVLEGQEMVRVVNGSNKVVNLSEQELVDCSSHNHGCNGGNMALAFDDLKSLGGVESFKDYPYRAVDGKCMFKKKEVVMTDAGYVMPPSKDEANLKQVLAKYGPVAVAIDATDNLIHYRSGVLDDSSCGNEMKNLNHGVLLVGYGTDPKHGDYWIIKNSWGVDLNDQGYFKLKRGVNMCGVALFPTIAKF